MTVTVGVTLFVMRSADPRPLRLPGAWLWRRAGAPLRRRTDRVEGCLAVLALLLSCLALPLGASAGPHLTGTDRPVARVAAGAPDRDAANAQVPLRGTWEGATGLAYAETAPPGRAGPSTVPAEGGVLVAVLWLAVVWGGFALAHRGFDRRRLRQWDAAWRDLSGPSP